MLGISMLSLIGIMDSPPKYKWILFIVIFSLNTLIALEAKVIELASYTRLKFLFIPLCLCHISADTYFKVLLGKILLAFKLGSSIISELINDIQHSRIQVHSDPFSWKLKNDQICVWEAKAYLEMHSHVSWLANKYCSPETQDTEPAISNCRVYWSIYFSEAKPAKYNLLQICFICPSSQLQRC